MNNLVVRRVSVVIFSVTFQFFKSCTGSPLFDGSNNWLDKLPSLEVKVKTDGITVKTGPSREEIYTMIGYIAFGLLVFAVLATAVIICACKYCRGRSLSHVPIQGIPAFPSHFNVPPTPNHHNGHIFGSPTVRTHYWPAGHDTTARSQYLDMKNTGSSNDTAQPSQFYRSTS